MARRIILVYNPSSSKYLKIREEVIQPLRKIGGYQIGKFEIQKAKISVNIERLAGVLMDGDLVILAGGDGTAAVGLNAAMISGADVTLGALGYGNFNDFARMLGEKDVAQLLQDFESGSVHTLFPLEVFIDGELWRYAACYFTMGMFAESTEAFEDEQTRAKLKDGKSGLLFSISTLKNWYFKNRRRDFLPKDIQLEDTPMNKMKTGKSGRINEVLVASKKRVSDVLFVNSETVARMMRGGDYWKRPVGMLVSYGRLLGLFRLGRFMLRSVLRGLPGFMKEESCKVDFSGPEEFEVQAEGEYARVYAKEVVVRKSTQGVKVIYRS